MVAALTLAIQLVITSVDSAVLTDWYKRRKYGAHKIVSMESTKKLLELLKNYEVNLLL